MEEHKLTVLAIQETHMEANTREVRDKYTWFFSGGSELIKGGKQFEAGVGFVISNAIMNAVIDIEPINDRLCGLVLRGRPNMNIYPYIYSTSREGYRR